MSTPTANLPHESPSTLAQNNKGDVSALQAGSHSAEQHVMNVRHDGDPLRANEAVVTYSRGGKLYDIRAKGVITA